MKKIVLLLVIAMFANVAFAQSIKDRLRRERMKEESGGKVNTSVPVKKKISKSGKRLIGEEMKCRSDFNCKNTYHDKRMACIDYKCHEVECLIDSQCNSKQICLNNMCRQGENVGWDDCKKLDCLNCKSGNQMLIIYIPEDGDAPRANLGFCVECSMSSDCIDVYMCNNNTCVRR